MPRYMAGRACALCVLQCGWRSEGCCLPRTVHVPRTIDDKWQQKHIQNTTIIVHLRILNVDAVKVL
jgi:hypothetical protein